MTKYELVDPSKGAFHKDNWCIKILDGDYAGLIYQYDTVKLDDSDPEGVVLRFNTINIDVPANMVFDNAKFEGIVSEILLDIINTEVDNGNRTSNPVESVE